jgi:hypothetical protein
VEPGSQVSSVALGDIALDRHDQAALGIDRDANIDALDRTTTSVRAITARRAGG